VSCCQIEWCEAIEEVLQGERAIGMSRGMESGRFTLDVVNEDWKELFVTW